MSMMRNVHLQTVPSQKKRQKWQRVNESERGGQSLCGVGRGAYSHFSGRLVAVLAGRGTAKAGAGSHVAAARARAASAEQSNEIKRYASITRLYIHLSSIEKIHVVVHTRKKRERLNSKEDRKPARHA